MVIDKIHELNSVIEVLTSNEAGFTFKIQLVKLKNGREIILMR